MNKIILGFFALSALIVISSAASTASATYTTKYDNIDIQEIIKNKRLLQKYFKCLMDEEKCTADGEELKLALPDALSNKCAKCSDKQKQGSEIMIRHLIDVEPDMWKKLEDKYDPKGTYRKAYKEDSKKFGIKI